MMFKCPVCGDRHSVPDKYDNKDYICMNTANRRTPKTFREMTPEDLLTKNSFLQNTRSTRVNEKRPATVEIAGTGYRQKGEIEEINSRKGYNY